MKQILLPITLDQRATFDTYIVGDNVDLIRTLQALNSPMGEKQLLIHADQRLGKTHLLQASCHLAAAHHLSAVYLPMREVLIYGMEVLHGLESLALVCLDDIDLIGGNDEWEEAIFHFINRIRLSSTRLLLSSQFAVDDLSIKLPDLHSRLQWGPQYAVKPLDDLALQKLMLKVAAQTGLTLSEEVLKYLVSHVDRDVEMLVQLIEALDNAAVGARRKVTIPFVRQWLSERKLLK